MIYATLGRLLAVRHLKKLFVVITVVVGVLGILCFIPIRVQNETNSLVLLASGVVARSLQPSAGMRLARASPEAQKSGAP